MHRTPVRPRVPARTEITPDKESPPRSKTAQAAKHMEEVVVTSSPEGEEVTQRRNSPQDKDIRIKKSVALTFPVEVNKTFTKRTPPKGTMDTIRVAEARKYLNKAKQHVTDSRNLKTEIKNGVLIAVDRLYALVKESEGELEKALAEKGASQGGQRKVTKDAQTQAENECPGKLNPIKAAEIIKCCIHDNDKKWLNEKLEMLGDGMQRHANFINKTTQEMEEKEKAIMARLEEMKQISVPKMSYAGVVAAGPGIKPPEYRTLHSVAVTSKDENTSADNVLKEVREALNAKQGGIEVERVRKARDGRVIISCRTPEEREKLKQKLSKERASLTAEDITNKQPMVMITGVHRTHTDDDLFVALRNQNKLVFEGLEEGDDRMEVAYKIRGRNPNTQRVIMKVSPPLWRRMINTATVRVDLQTLQVTDRSPLTQCTTCLGFGHGKKLCTETQIVCSHCGGPHTRNECEEYTVGAPPKCKNCVKEKKAETDHNAFSEVCPVRARWDAIVRATVAYC